MTYKLLPCPFCGGTPILELFNDGFFDYARIRCCRVMFDWCGDETGEQAIAAWNRRAQSKNKPLTLDELRQMDGEAVWAVDGSGNQAWVLIDVDSEHRPNGIDKETGLWDGDFYGMTCGCEVLKCECKCPYGLHPRGWLAYDYPPNDNT